MRKSKWIVWSVSLIAAAGFSAASADAAMTRVTVVGAGKGAGAFRMAGGLAEAVNKSSKTVNVTNSESAGLVANTRLVAGGRAELGMTSGFFVDFWQRKKAPFAKDPGSRDSLRGIGPVSGSWFQMAVLKSSGIKSFEDLAGKRVNMGPKGSSTLFMTKFITDALGITGKIRKDYLGWTDAANNLIDGKLDAFGIPNPVPSPSVLQASRSAPIRVLSLPENIRDKFLELSGGYFKDERDAGVYKGMEGQKFKTIAYILLVTTNKNVPNDVIYEVTRQTYDPKNRQFLLNVFKGWKVGLDMVAKGDEFLRLMKKFRLTVHPGAARYWKERGYLN